MTASPATERAPADRAQLDRWMAAAAEGDRAAIAPLFQALWPIAVRYATRMLGDAARAEDCAQDALVQLFGQVDRYERDRDALTWALTLVTWRCRTARRQHGRRGDTALVDDGMRGDDGGALVEHRDLVRAALETLETLAPRDVEAITVAISESTSSSTVPPATFRKRLERALARFRTSWRSRHGTL